MKNLHAPSSVQNKMVEILTKSLTKSDADIWNTWKSGHRRNNLLFEGLIISKYTTKPLEKYDFSGIHFKNCTFENIHFIECNFERCTFSTCEFVGSRSRYKNNNFKSAIFNHVNFSHISFTGSVLSDCKFRGCTLENLNLFGASLLNSDFRNSQITDCDIFGANIWNVTTVRTTQKDLKMPYGKTKKFQNGNEITIDDMELANIVYLLSVNSNFTNFIDQTKSNFALILGRFGENLQRLDEIKKALRRENISPIVFDFAPSEKLDLIEIIILLALLSKFIIVDLSEPRSVPGELQAILASLMIPVVPILQRKSQVYGTYSFTNRYTWVLPVLVFNDIEEVTDENVFRKAILNPANKLFKEINKIKNQKLKERDVKNFQ